MNCDVQVCWSAAVLWYLWPAWVFQVKSALVFNIWRHFIWDLKPVGWMLTWADLSVTQMQKEGWLGAHGYSDEWFEDSLCSLELKSWCTMNNFKKNILIVSDYDGPDLQFRFKVNQCAFAHLSSHFSDLWFWSFDSTKRIIRLDKQTNKQNIFFWNEGMVLCDKDRA